MHMKQPKYRRGTEAVWARGTDDDSPEMESVDGVLCVHLLKRTSWHTKEAFHVIHTVSVLYDSAAPHDPSIIETDVMAHVDIEERLARLEVVLEANVELSNLSSELAALQKDPTVSA